MEEYKLPKGKILSWATTLEPEALQQAKNTAQLPFVHRHLALMPDAHYGKGATIGSVIATKGAIVPAAVGVDIGCGMVAKRLNYTKDELTSQVSLQKILDVITQVVPVKQNTGINPSKY